MPPFFPPSIVRLLMARVVGLVDLILRLLLSMSKRARGGPHLPPTEMCEFMTCFIDTASALFRFLVTRIGYSPLMVTL